MTDPRMPEDDQLVTRTLTVREWRKIANTLHFAACVQDGLGDSDDALIETCSLISRVREGIEEVTA